MKKLFLESFVFSKPKKTPILFYDNTNSHIIKKKLNRKKYSTLFLRNKKINLIILLKTILNFDFSYKKYIYHYINYVRPKLVITFIDNDYNFYTLKKKFPNIIFIAVQSGYRSFYRDFFLQLKKLKKLGKIDNLRADHIFLYGKAIEPQYAKYINFKASYLGSYRNNSVTVAKNKEKKKTLLFISQWRNNQWLKDHKFTVENKLLPILQNFCEEKKFELSILGTQLAKKEKREEFLFFSNLLPKKNWNFIERKSLLSNFKIIDKFNLITFVDSTLGYESIARKKKIAVFSCRAVSNLYPPERFSWALNIKKKGFFYSNSVAKKEVFRVLKNFKNIKKKFFYEKYSNILEKIIVNDQNNKILL